MKNILKNKHTLCFLSFSTAHLGGACFPTVHGASCSVQESTSGGGERGRGGLFPACLYLTKLNRRGRHIWFNIDTEGMLLVPSSIIHPLKCGAIARSTATPQHPLRTPHSRAVLHVRSFPVSAKLSAMADKGAVYEGFPVSTAVAEARTQKADLNMVSIDEA